MQVMEILAQKGTDVATIRPDEPIGAAVDRLGEMRIGALVVTTDGSHIEGIVSERDIVRALASGQTDLMNQPTSAIMTAEVITCDLDDRVEELMQLMTARRIRHLPVAPGGSLGGIISIGDVVKSRLAELEQEAKALEDYIRHGR
ncbi:MAG: CBS domain-containing protein [Acidimicrobiales bacterium]